MAALVMRRPHAGSPAAGLMGAAAHEGVAAFSSDTAGVLVIGALALVIAGSVFRLARRDHVTSKNVVAPSRPAGVAVRVGAGAPA